MSAVGRAEATQPPNSGPLRVVSYRVDDIDGDRDGYPDTGETADLYLSVWNATASTLTNVTVQASTSDPRIDCLLATPVTIPSLLAGSTVELPAAFQFRVADTADRSGTNPAATCAQGVCSNGAGACTTVTQCQKTSADDYSALFRITSGADQAAAASRSLAVTLDLNVSNSVDTTSTYTEGFESGLGSFQFMNLDVDYLGGSMASNFLSNGHRCQYNDPDYVNSNSYGETECYLGFIAPQSPINAWHTHTTLSPDGGRAYVGSNSLHYGSHTPGNPGLDTYGLSQMDALRTKSNINLAARVCQALQAGMTNSCSSSADCTNPASACVAASPVLSFKQQISTVDYRYTSTPFGEAADRAVVGVLVSGSAIWQKLYPFQNVYDVQGTDFFSSCTFDPIDDGSDEDSYSDPTDPNRRYGPSSTCYPEFAFSYLGDTFSPFLATNIGRASDGPGLEGSLGQGTWVESRFDLSNYRGQGIRVRLLFTSIKVSDSRTHQSLFGWNPTPADDGWYIDDIQVTQTLSAASTVSVDTAGPISNASCGGACGGAQVCDDSNPCTDDSCLPGVGCQHVSNTAACDDRNACTSTDRCAQGTCAGSSTCYDGDPSTIDHCDPETGCEHVDTCNDGNVCTDDAGTPASGCVHTNNAKSCNDGDGCTVNDTCSDGACVPGAPVNCDDGNACTNDSCTAASGCVQTNNTASCNDGDACTVNDTCSGGACEPGARVNCDDGYVCTTDWCDPATGCVREFNSYSCDDGNACSVNDTCSGGVCVPGTPVNCYDGNDCTTDSCNPATGACIHTNNSEWCSDGNFCTVNDVCSGGVCTGGVCYCASRPPGLVGWWPGDGNGSDIGGSGNNGTPVNGATFAAGEVGQAFSLDGVNDYITNLGTTSSYSFIQNTGVFTIAAWIWLNDVNALSVQAITASTSTTAEKGHFFLWSNPAGQHQLRLALLKGTPNVPMIDSLSPTQVITTNGWHHVAVRGDGTTVDFFVDGIMYPGTGTMETKSTGASTRVLDIGRCPYSSPNCQFAGLIDEVQIYDRPITSWDSAAMYHAGTHGVCKQCTDADRDGYGAVGSVLCHMGSSVDCDDTSWAVMPGAPDVTCNGIDENCNGQMDEGMAGGCLCSARGSGLLGWWPGQNDANDISGNGNHGTLMNGASYAAGTVGQGFSLDGIDDHVLVSDIPSDMWNSLTLEAWVKPNSVDAQGIVISKYNTYEPILNGTSWVLSMLAGGLLRFYVYGDATGNASFRGVDTNAQVLFPGTWSHVAATFEVASQALHVYVNGSEVPATLDPTSTTVSIYDSATPVRIGAAINSTGALFMPFAGIIDEPAVYGITLTATEVRAIYDAGGTGMCQCQDPDGDGYGAAGGVLCARGTQQDCLEGDPSVWAVPGEAASLLAARTAPAGSILLAWSPPVTGGTPAGTTYDVVRGGIAALPVGPGGGDESCFDNLSAASVSDSTVPASGAGFWYLSRGENTCGNGTYGTQGVHGTPGATRITTTCP